MNMAVAGYYRIGSCMYRQFNKWLIVSVSTRGSVDYFGHIDYIGIRHIVRQKLKLLSPVQTKLWIGEDAYEFSQGMRTDKRNN